MYRLLFFICLSVTAGNVLAQGVPQSLPYQGIARNAAGQPLANTSITVRLSIRDALSGGNTLYTETKSVATGGSGLYSLVIHDGSGAFSGDWNSINWAAGARFLKTEIDPANGSSFLDFGTVQLQSVPYALTAGKAVDQKLSELKDVSTSALLPGDRLEWSGSGWKNAAKSQTYSFAGPIPSLSGNNSVYVFAGPAATLAVTSSDQVIKGGAVAPLGFQTGASPATVRIGMGYQRIDISGQPIVNFVGSNYATHRLIAERRTYSAFGSVTGLAPGTYKVGMVVLNGAPAVVSDNDYVNGWVTVE